MLCVKTKIKESSIHGIGLFADEFIKKGTVIWRFTPGFDLKLTEEEILKLPEAVQIYLSRYMWKSKKSGKYCFSSDNGKFFNHSNDQNCSSEYFDEEEESLVIALKDISLEEELTDNYSSFEDDDYNISDYIYEKYNLVDEVDPRTKQGVIL